MTINMNHTPAILVIIAAAVFGAASTACAQPVAVSQAEQRGRLFGLAEGVAHTISMTSTPTRIEPFTDPNASLPNLERRTYIKPGLTVVVVAQRNAQVVLPISVELTSEQAIRDFSKELSEIPKSGVIPSFGQPSSKTEHSFRYQGPAESCEEFVELLFRSAKLSGVKWSFCGE